MNKQQLASKIWESANKMRSNIEANEYKDYILGFIFYKYLSDTQEKFLRENDFSTEDITALTESDPDTVTYIQNGIGYFIAYNNLFSTWLRQGNEFGVGNVRDALSAFSRLISKTHHKVFERILDTLQTGLSKLGRDAASQSKAIRDLTQLINAIPMDGRQDYDVLGFIYEYLIGKFAANAGKKAGEFYTPHQVSLLMSEIIAHHVKGEPEIKIYDPTSGSGSLLINIGRCVARHIANENNIKYYAQEIKENTYNLTRMNLIMRGILPDNIVARNGDTLEEDWPYFDDSDPIRSYNPLYVDAVVSNPPYSQAWDPKNKENDPRYARYGIAPKTKADYAFLLHDLYHLKPGGIMTIVLPHGVLFRGGEEGKIRQNLIENNHIDAIIGLPANIFFGTGIPTIVMVLKKHRENTGILIVDASRGFAKEGKNNVLRACDIRKIIDTVTTRASVDKYSRLVTLEEIRANDYNLNIPRYVDSSAPVESWDIYATMFGGVPSAELATLEPFWRALPGLQDTLFAQSETPCRALAVDDVASAIKNHPAVQHFLRNYAAAFADFTPYLRSQLIDGWQTLYLPQQQETLSNALFQRLAPIPLIDPYSAYQALDNEWVKTAVDLETLQTEGWNAARKVDPRLVIKKKDGKEQEVQDGWVGHIIPFELVQATVIKEEAQAISALEERLAEIQAASEALIETLSEEDKESDALNEAKDAFVPANVAKIIKEQFGSLAKAKAAIKTAATTQTSPSDDETSFEQKLVRAQELIDEEKSLKTRIKKDTDALHQRTKETIETLSDTQIATLLEAKWITPLVTALAQLPHDIIASLITSVRALADKYATTCAQIATDIASTQNELATLIDGLTGSPFDMQGLNAFQNLLKGQNREQ